MISEPELKTYLNKTLRVTLNSNRLITGKLIGYDFFLNLNLVEVNEINKVGSKGKNKEQKEEFVLIGNCIIRGNSVIAIEIMD